MVKHFREAVAAAKGVVFDLFHTLTARESEWSSGPMTHQLLGVTRADWEKRLFATSRFRLAGLERDHFEIVARMAHAIDSRITDEVITLAVRNRLERFRGALQHIPRPTVALLSALRSNGVKLGLVSNADAMEIAAWPASPLAGRFDSTIFSCEVGWVKPEPEIFLLCVREMGLAPRECLFVGDGGANELAAARSVGFTTVMVTGIIRELWPDKIEVRAKDADFVIEEPFEILSKVTPIG